MLEIEYTTTNQEAADATLDFMSNRPMVAFIFKFMRTACIVLCVIFAFLWYKKAIRPQDYIALITATAWLFFYKKINRRIISKTIGLRKLGDIKCICKIDDRSILYKVHNFAPLYIEWKKLRFVLKNKDGYIIPLTGLTNAGRFIWLPQRVWQNHDMEQQFLNLVQKFKLKVRTVTS